MVTSMLLVVAVVPFGNGSFLANLNIGVLYLVGIPTIATVSMFLGGWGSGNRFALLGAARAVAMLISYEVPVSYTHLRAHETLRYRVCSLRLEK